MQHEMQHENKKPRDFGVFYMEVMGLEPMTSRVWGERSSQLSYASKTVCNYITYRRKMQALISSKFSGDNGIRTRDLCVANATLSQLSYVPVQTVIIIAQLEWIASRE